MRDVLTSEFRFTPADIAKIEGGRAVAKIAATGRLDDIRMAGAVLIKVSSRDFIKAFRDVEHFQMSKEVIRTGRFSNPAVEADVAGFHLPDLKADIAAFIRDNARTKFRRTRWRS